MIAGLLKFKTYKKVKFAEFSICCILLFFDNSLLISIKYSITYPLKFNRPVRTPLFWRFLFSF